MEYLLINKIVALMDNYDNAQIKCEIDNTLHFQTRCNNVVNDLLT